MSYAVTASLNFGFTAQEVADGTTSPDSSTQGAGRIFDALAKSLQFSSATFPPTSGRVVSLRTTLASSPVDYDLTAAKLAADVAETVDMTGFKLVGGVLYAPKTNNAAGIVVSCPANGYPLFGSASDRITLLKGKRYQLGCDGLLDSLYANPNAAVDATHKLIRIAGTTPSDELYGLLIFGT